VILQIARFGDGSRRVQAISECMGLDEQNNYRFQDLYRFVARGRDANGRIEGELVPSGVKPTFSGEPFQMGYGDQVVQTSSMFAPPGSSS
jgi:pilus assembly protein CpaF